MTLALEPEESVAIAPLYENDSLVDITPTKYFRWRPLLGWFLALFLLIPALPIIIVTAILVRLTSRGPGIFGQVRVTKAGRVFVMYKIRTMIDNAEATTGPVWAHEQDDRITPLGRFLRRFHLDELPQLINVIKGEMALVGPRPERPEIIPSLVQQVPGYLNRLAVPAGITGLAQVNLAPDTDIESVRAKLLLDLEYIRQATIWLDVRIFLYHLLRACFIPTERALCVLGLHRQTELSQPTLPAAAQSFQAARRNGDTHGNGHSGGRPAGEGGLSLSAREHPPEIDS